VAGSLERRIRNLETGRRECPECGFPGDWSKVTYTVEWCDSEAEDDGPEETVYCEACGEPVGPEGAAVVWDDAWETGET
jgi:hypothetical protein